MRSGRIRRQLITSCPLANGALAFDIGRARFQPDYVLLMKLQFSRVLDGHDTLAVRE